MLEWTIERVDGAPISIRFKGAITEAACFDELAVVGTEVVLVVDGVRYINSTGLQRLWGFLEPLAKRCRIQLDRCSPAVVVQLNMMPALADCVNVRSVIAPLECTECIAETDVLIEVDEGAPAIPARACEVCGAKMVLAELEQRYFAFLS